MFNFSIWQSTSPCLLFSFIIWSYLGCQFFLSIVPGNLNPHMFKPPPSHPLLLPFLHKQTDKQKGRNTIHIANFKKGKVKERFRTVTYLAHRIVFISLDLCDNNLCFDWLSGFKLIYIGSNYFDNIGEHCYCYLRI